MSAHILLTDDDLRLTGLVGDYLRQAGFFVETAPTLQSAREALGRRDEAYDALVLDLMLPD
ncbi:hypothetical protein OFC63_31740, partial [Escherichia coli]|nr:hypothetical protein [Escherichia coli]